MSGGHFNYDQYKIQMIADEVEELILKNGSDEVDSYGYKLHSEYLPETIEEFKKAMVCLKMAYVYAQRIDWLVSGDDGEDSFHRRLKNDLEKVNEN